ncbi:MAG: hypothetical protein WBJ84_07725 [Bacteroidales bacterium]
MFSKSFFKTALIAGLTVAMAQGAFAQKTADELKAEREVLKSEMNSKEAKKLEKVLEKIAPIGGTMADFVTTVLNPSLASVPEIQRKAVPSVAKLVGNEPARIVNKPAATRLNSVDGLVDAGTTLLGVVVSTNAVLSKYKIAITESKDGEVDITQYKANLDDYIAILPMLVQADIDATKAVEKIKYAQADLKGLNPIQAAPTIKASNWAIDAVNVSVWKIAENTKLLQNLINSIKVAGNL